MTETTSAGESLVEALRSVRDHRGAQGKRYDLAVLLAMSVAALLCGSRSLYAIAQWGRDNQKRVCSALGIERGSTPCVATLHRVFKELDVVAFERVLAEWLGSRFTRPGEGIAIDGKALRGIHGEEIPGVHLVAAYTHTSGLVLAQSATIGKGQELKTGEALLDYLDCAGHVITGDALYAQREFSQRVLDRGGTIC
jgi:hypothetical protein